MDFEGFLYFEKLVLDFHLKILLIHKVQDYIYQFRYILIIN